MNLPRTQRSTPAIFLIADDDEAHVAFVREQLAVSSLHLTVTAHSAAEALLYLNSLVVHNPTQRAVPCVLLLGFGEDADRLPVLQTIEQHPSLRPRRVVVFTDEPPSLEEEALFARGVDAVISRYSPRAVLADLFQASPNVAAA